MFVRGHFKTASEINLRSFVKKRLAFYKSRKLAIMGC
jgi:hypothetical protein